VPRKLSAACASQDNPNEVSDEWTRCHKEFHLALVAARQLIERHFNKTFEIVNCILEAG
jgi:hypothetical protein